MFSSGALLKVPWSLLALMELEERRAAEGVVCLFGLGPAA